jgi:tight adherence protein B
MLPILIAGAVMMFVYGIAQIVAALTDAEKRKLKQRLTGDSNVRPGIDSGSPQLSLTRIHDAGSVTTLLTKFSFFDRLNTMLVYAYPEMSLAQFVSIALGIGALAGMLTFLVSDAVIVALVAAVMGVYGPCVWLSNKRARRQRLLVDQLPEALDFLGRILKAGHSLSTGLQMMAEELPQPLATEFRRAYDAHSLGQAMDECLKDMAKRIDSTDFAFFVTAVLIQRQTGGDLSEVLDNISGMIRQRIRLQQHVKAKTAEGRFTGYILAGFPAVMFVIAYSLNPSYAGVLIHTTTGLMLLAVAFGLQIIGLYFIKKITTVAV